MNSNCACVRSTTLDNFALDQTSLDKLQSSRLHSTRWPNALDFSLNMHVERCIVKSREHLARALISRVRVKAGVKPRPNTLDFSLDLELNIPQMYCLMNNSFMECFVHYLMNSNCACVRSTTLDNFALDQTLLDKLQSSRLHSTRWPNALDISLNMHVERCIVKSRERLARALVLWANLA